ncbi:MAG TPA: hypothetical protein VJ965_09050 [Anaerolineales bacterium]|nr:hypothetical protein [Anaerolineales bacterium]
MKAQMKHALKLGRWQMRRAQLRLKHGQVSSPVLFANSFPKSGTHLLTQVLAGFAQFGPFAMTGLNAVTMYDGPTGAPRPMAEIETVLHRLRPGDISYGHLHAEPEIISALCREGVAPYFILRDPRDVVVSHVFYVTELEPNHVHHRYYAEELHTFEERLRVSILGRPELAHPFPDIRGRFEPYMGWLDRPEMLVLRFEDFILNRRETLGRVLVHAAARGFAYDGDLDAAVDLLSATIDPENSPTFRSGKVGGWKAHFTPAFKDLFKQVSGDLLIRLGYEQDVDW